LVLSRFIPENPEEGNEVCWKTNRPVTEAAE
jgi:hypothetical protein